MDCTVYMVTVLSLFLLLQTSSDQEQEKGIQHNSQWIRKAKVISWWQSHSMEHYLENIWKVSEIKNIMKLYGSRQEHLWHFVV
jgi:hypothetical protein